MSDQDHAVHGAGDVVNQLEFRLTDPSTSRRAAADNRPRRGSHRWLALDLLACSDGLTDFDLAALSGLQQTSIGKRRKELVDLGFCEWAGIERPAPSGSMARVWKITASGSSYWLDNR